MLIDPRPEKFQSEKSPSRVEKGIWERVSYPSGLPGKKRGGGGHRHCITVEGMIWNIKCRNEVG